MQRAHLMPLGIGTAYLVFFMALLTPYLQKQFIFLHNIKFPFFPKFDNPEKYGLAPFKVRNFKLTTSDNVKIGAWHILPEEFYQKEMTRRARDGSTSETPLLDSTFDDALKNYPTVIYLHGNAANRAAPFRVRTYSHLTARLPVNVVAIDYRGYGDSEGDPSEDGLVRDARAAWDYVLSRSGRSDIVLFGQSLGTGVASKLARQLHQQGTPPRGLILMAPYMSLRSLVKDYRVGGTIPVLAPVKLIPFHDALLDSFLTTHFETINALPALLTGQGPRPSIVILHADNDAIIPVDHGRRLFDSLVGEKPLTRRSIDGFGTISKIELDGKTQHSDTKGSAASATFINTLHGGHDHIGEGAVDEIGRALHLIA